mgnify:CR=1 FL=1
MPGLHFVYSSLVYALPAVLVMLGETLVFPNYRLARDAEGRSIACLTYPLSVLWEKRKFYIFVGIGKGTGFEHELSSQGCHGRVG